MKKRAFLALALSMVTLFGACTAGGGGSSSIGDSSSSVTQSVKVEPQDVQVWSAPATEKVLKDKLTGYDDIKGAAKIDVFSAKGEYEGEHLILTSPQKDVTGIDLQSFDLTLTGDSNVKFPKENVEIFFEKYLEVKKIYDNNGAPTGKYPDALIPMQSIVDCGENVMSAGTNQGLYVRFNVPKEQQAGTYTGSLKLKYGGNEQNIPVTLTVADLTVSEETHSRSLFISEWQYRLGELDSTQAMLDKYVQAGLEYRISPAGVVYEDDFSDAGIAYYVDKAVEAMSNPKCSHVAIPLQHEVQTRVIDGEEITASAVKSETMVRVLHAFIERSLADGVDYVKKLGTHLVDEPQLNNALARTKLTTTIFKETLTMVADELALEDIADTAFRDTLVQSVRNVRAIITASYEDSYVGYIDTWCPTVNYYDSESQRANYDSQEEKWWYTCISPRAPFPTYHIEDTLLSARALSWMQAEYDVVGNLYWATNVYANYDGTKYVNIEDFFEGDASRFAQVNGDGFLFYPGKPYGIDGPIGSLRLEAIRDGLEEYEILYELKQNYKQVAAETGLSLNANNAIRNLTTDLYAGTRVSTTSDLFASAREALINMAMMSSSGAKLSIIDYADDNYGKITYRVFATEGYQLYNGESLVSPSETVTGGNIYTIVNTLDKDSNAINLRLTNGVEEYTFSKNLGGKVASYTAEEMVADFKADDSTVTATLVDASTLVSGESGNFAKLEIGAVEVLEMEDLEKAKRVALDSNIVRSITSNTKKVVLRIYCEGLTSEGISFAFMVKHANGKFTEAVFTTLHNGMNEVQVNAAVINFVSAGDIVMGYFRVGSKNEQAVERTIYLKDMTIYNK